ncbi:MAG: ATP phosphoribosyltransferase regulatory subunit [Firmicutes bacterium]|nr:ATP phosphoribosyltransferase regulatory subunit [Bacillota bacterium]
MEFTLAFQSPEDRALYKLGALYKAHGYKLYKMSKFEEYDLYLRNKDFLVSSEIITFTDTTGKLMALKPDVTLSIIKNSSGTEALQKLFYHENVYRISKGSQSFKEIMQCGLECIGNIGLYEQFEVLKLAALSLEKLSAAYVLDVSHLGLISALFAAEGVPQGLQKQLMAYLEQKNSHDLQRLCAAEGLSAAFAATLTGLASCSGAADEVLPQLQALSADAAYQAALAELAALCALLEQAGLGKHINVDFSIVNDMGYYSGLVFRGYIDGIPGSLLSGGRYDKLMQKMGRSCGAIGFAVYLDMLELLPQHKPPYEVDVLLTYEAESCLPQLVQQVQKLRDEGCSVLVQRDGFSCRCRKQLHINAAGEVVERV